jgi:hypothetical protein
MIQWYLLFIWLERREIFLRKKNTKKRSKMLMNEIEWVYIKQKNIVLHDTKICIVLNMAQAF